MSHVLGNFSPISALIGAFITALFAYIVRVVIDRRSDRKKQQRLALLYLIRVSRITATKNAVESVFKESLDKMRSKAAEIGGGYALHYMCVGLCKILQFATDNEEFITQMKKLAYVTKELSSDEYLGFKFDDNLLSNLPADTIIQYHYFIENVGSVNATFKLWMTLLEMGDFSSLTPFSLHSQLIGLKRLLESAERLRRSLIKESSIEAHVANDIFSQQYNYFGRLFTDSVNNRNAIQVIDDSIQFVKKEDVEAS